MANLVKKIFNFFFEENYKAKLFIFFIAYWMPVFLSKGKSTHQPVRPIIGLSHASKIFKVTSQEHHFEAALSKTKAESHYAM